MQKAIIPAKNVWELLVCSTLLFKLTQKFVYTYLLIILFFMEVKYVGGLMDLPRKAANSLQRFLIIFLRQRKSDNSILNLCSNVSVLIIIQVRICGTDEAGALRSANARTQN